MDYFTLTGSVSITVKCIIHSFTSALESATCVSVSVGVPWHLFPSRGNPAAFIFDSYGIPVVLLGSLSSPYTARPNAALVFCQRWLSVRRGQKSALAIVKGSLVQFSAGMSE